MFANRVPTYASPFVSFSLRQASFDKIESQVAAFCAVGNPRAFFEQLPALARDHGEAALIDPEQAPAAPIPLHAGAARYYREREVLR